PNDADGETNGVVLDPGAVGRPAEVDEEPEPEPEPPGTDEQPDYEVTVKSRSSGGGHTGAWFLLLSAGLWLSASVKRRKGSRRIKRGRSTLRGFYLLPLILTSGSLLTVDSARA